MRSLLSLTLLTLSISAHAQVIDLKDNNPSFAPILGGVCMGVFKGEIIWETYSNGNSQTHMYRIGTDNKLVEVNRPVGGAPAGHAPISNCAQINGRMYFSHKLDTSLDYRMCSWDGVTDPVFLGPGYDSWFEQAGVALDNKLYFINQDYDHLWVTMYDPASFTFRTLSSLDTCGYLIPFNSKLYFLKDLSTWSRESPFYVYDPATDSTSLVPGSDTDYGSPVEISVLNNKLYFIAVSKPGTTLGLYEYDGVTTPKKISGSLRVSAPWGITENKTMGLFKNEIYFSTDTLLNGKNLYKYNPQSSVLTPIHTFSTYPSSDFTVHNNKLLFVASDAGTNSELWQYDGMAAPTLLADINGSGAGSRINSLTVANGNIYFIADNTSGTSIFRLAGGLDVLELTEAIEEVTLYPNPVTDVATLSFNLKKNTTVSAIISDMTGKEVYRLTQQAPAGTNKIQLDINKLVPGNYTYRLMSDEGKTYASGKFVKN